MIVNMLNPNTNQFKQCKIGFSWTLFFFGFWVPLFRGDWKWLIIMMIIDIMGCFSYGTLTVLANIVMAFLYNKIYVSDLIAHGYQPQDKASLMILKQNHLLV